MIAWSFYYLLGFLVAVSRRLKVGEHVMADDKHIDADDEVGRVSR